MSENRKDLVEEQKRRARRRLVGAAVLALAAAVIVPLFLESEPKPLGQDVQILIPAVDGSKFVSQLSSATDAPAKASGSEPPAASPAAKQEAKPETALSKQGEALSPAGGSGAKNTASSGETASKSTPVESPKPPAPAVTAAPKASDPQATAPPAGAASTAKMAPAAKNGAKPVPANTTVSAKHADSGFVVQLGAYSDAKVAQDLQAKLKTAGFAAYVDRVETSKEKLHRVRVGPYSSREAADGARAQLKAKGHSGIVATLS